MTQFLSTPSARRATHLLGVIPDGHADFYPRPPRGGRPRPQRLRGHQRAISIHALREEGDKVCKVIFYRLVPFLSTPSARRATKLAAIVAGDGSISIHALREEGDV